MSTWLLPQIKLAPDETLFHPWTFIATPGRSRFLISDFDYWNRFLKAHARGDVKKFHVTIPILRDTPENPDDSLLKVADFAVHRSLTHPFWSGNSLGYLPVFTRRDQGRKVEQASRGDAFKWWRASPRDPLDIENIQGYLTRLIQKTPQFHWTLYTTNRHFELLFKEGIYLNTTVHYHELREVDFTQIDGMLRHIRPFVMKVKIHLHVDRHTNFNDYNLMTKHDPTSHELHFHCPYTETGSLPTFFPSHHQVHPTF